MEKRLHNATDRLAYIDVAKGLLIISVVLGHITDYNHIFTAAVKTFIYTFHMPAFFVISGILMRLERIRAKSLREFVCDKLFRLIIPYVFFEITGGMLQMMLFGTESVNMKGIIFSLLVVKCHVGALWFLPTLFFAEMILYWIIKAHKEKILPFLALLFLLIAFGLSNTNYFVMHLRRILISTSFIVVGICGRQFFAKKSVMGMILACIAVVLISFLNGVVDLAGTQFGNPMLYVAGSIVGSYLVLDFSQYISGWLTKGLSRIGRSSLIIMGTHQNVQVVVNVLYGSVYPIWLQPIVFAITIIYEFFTIRIYERWIPFFVGIRSNHKG